MGCEEGLFWKKGDVSRVLYFEKSEWDFDLVCRLACERFCRGSKVGARDVWLVWMVFHAASSLESLKRGLIMGDAVDVSFHGTRHCPRLNLSAQ